MATGFWMAHVFEVADRLAVMRRAMATALWRFSTTRMLHEYTESLYLPAAGVTSVM